MPPKSRIVVGLLMSVACACSASADSVKPDRKITDERKIDVMAVYYPHWHRYPKEMREWIPNSRYGAHAFGYSDFDQWLEHRTECLAQIEKYSPAALLRKCPPGKAARFFYTCHPLPPPSELPKDPTHAAMFCVKFEELCKARGVFCRAGTREDFLSCLAGREARD